MREIIEGLAMLAGNPLSCSAIRSVQLFGAVCAVIVAAHAAFQLVLTRRLRAAWEIAPASETRLQRIFEKAVRRSGLRRVPALRMAGRGAGACTIGFWRPDICVSPALAAQLDDDEMESVLLHELAHAARRDTMGASLLLFGGWAAVFLASTGYVLAERLGADTFHLGAVWSRLLIGAAIAIFMAIRFVVTVPGKFLRELTCDDMAVRVSGNPLALAAALIKASAPERHGDRAGTVASWFAGEQSFVLHRIRRLLEYEPPRIRLAVQRAASALTLLAVFAAITIFTA
ncbi:MAG TPA: M56 family metallopeptidase [Thermoanaerobaculia bacterium]|nr:M56 family metallopeptidase [Thermoanaerobaculia bacterium]